RRNEGAAERQGAGGHLPRRADGLGPPAGQSAGSPSESQGLSRLLPGEIARQVPPQRQAPRFHPEEATMTTITTIHAREILDSRGNPTLEAEVALSDGSFGRAAV